MLSHAGLHGVLGFSSKPGAIAWHLICPLSTATGRSTLQAAGSTQARVQIASKEVCMLVPLLKDGSYIAVASSSTQAIGAAK